MKLFLKKLEKIFFCALLYFEQYFLGQKTRFHNEYQDFLITVDGHPLRGPGTLLLEEDREDFPVLSYTASGLEERPATFIAIAPAILSHLSIKLCGPLSSSFLLRPSYLEQILPMINSLEHQLQGNGPVVVVLFYISQMPCKKELLSCISSSTMHDYDRAYNAFLIKIKRILSKQKIVLIIDRKETLGKKNSALLRRMFRNN